ncbi:MAG: hypothetical protein ACJATI_004311 [Halioglobus sp.]|jgi:hypothetical protein
MSCAQAIKITLIDLANKETDLYSNAIDIYEGKINAKKSNLSLNQVFWNIKMCTRNTLKNLIKILRL